jgi:hypothetical protein
MPHARNTARAYPHTATLVTEVFKFDPHWGFVEKERGPINVRVTAKFLIAHFGGRERRFRRVDGKGADEFTRGDDFRSHRYFIDTSSARDLLQSNA